MIGWVDSTGTINGINSVILGGSLSLFFSSKIVKISKPPLRKPAFCICENKGPNQLHSNRATDQCLCFCYIDSTMPQPSKSEITSLKPSFIVVRRKPNGRFSECGSNENMSVHQAPFIEHGK